ncbi:MAG: hypothetical protein ACD_33C00045G0025 [uncultured bacterium]|nr:MAG: hypothetical protein ACD_33C00045G0025 [uncultured bacterium]
MFAEPVIPGVFYVVKLNLSNRIEYFAVTARNGTKAILTVLKQMQEFS